MKKLLYLSIAFFGLSFCMAFNANGQGVGISPSGSSPDSSAGLDVNFTNKGFLMPRLSTAQRDAISSPAEGLQIFNTTTKCFEAYVLNAWNTIACPGCVVPTVPGTITGATSVCPGVAGITYSISAVANATSYTWTVPTGATITSGQASASITVTFGSSSGFVSVLANSNCGSSTANALAVTINPAAPSTPGTITGPTSTCSTSAGNVYSVSSVANATTYTWGGPAGAFITAGQGTTSITVTFAYTPGDVTVTAANSCGTSAASTLAVILTGSGSGSQTFDYTGSIQSFTVPECVTTITIEAWGAQGGSNGMAGGLGAYETGIFTVTPNSSISILVGGTGAAMYAASGGGGGSFAWNPANTTMPYIAAAGGGGAMSSCNGSNGTYDASGTTTPNAGSCRGSALPGSGGNGGLGGFAQDGSGAGGGTGWLTPGSLGGGGGSTGPGGGGGTPLSGGAGGGGNNGHGGYGGGGGASSGGGGGGGGYNGGGGGNYPNIGGGGGGGGGSYNGGSNTAASTSGVRSGNGQIKISW